jgi:hypothetical protein
LHDDQFEMEGWDALEDRLLALSDDATYLVLFDRTDRQDEKTVGRFDLDEEGTTAWMDGVYSFAEALEGACRWVCSTAVAQTVGESMRRFRVRVYGPKGLSTMLSGSFAVRNHGYVVDLDDDLPAELQMVDGEAVGMAALGQYYAQFGKLLLASTMRLQSMSDRTLSRMGRQLEESRSQIDTLVAATLEYRFREVEAAEVRSAETREVESRNQLVREAVGQLADAAKAVATMGPPAELAPVLAMVQDKPERLELLQSEPVKELLAKPEDLKALLAMIAPGSAP